MSDFVNNWAFIQNGICINMAYFESAQGVSDFKTATDGKGIYDELVPQTPGYWIGDLYVAGVWSHPGQSIMEPSAEDRVTAIEDALLTMM